MQHTPGPWHWEADAVKGDPFGRVRYQVTALGKTITKVYYSSFEGGPTNAECDARLIAAAPEMLAALQTILNISLMDKGNWARTIEAEAFAAIQRATKE